MAALTITAAEVQKTATTVSKSYRAGATIGAGQVVYIDTDNEAQLSDADGAAALRAVKGIAINSASDQQPIEVAIAGDITLGATAAPVRGTAYFLGKSAAGALGPFGDLAAGDTSIFVCIGIGSNRVRLNPTVGGAIPT